MELTIELITRRFNCPHDPTGLVTEDAVIQESEVQIGVSCPACGAHGVDCCPLDLIVSGHVIPEGWDRTKPIGGIDESVAFARCCLGCGAWTFIDESSSWEKPTEQLCDSCRAKLQEGG